MKNQLFAVIALAALLSGCSSDPKPPSDLTIITPDDMHFQHASDGSPAAMANTGSPSDRAGVRTGVPSANVGQSVVIAPGIKAYPIARYVDPNNPRVMHERHVLYVREGDLKWRLDAPVESQILIGNVVGEGPVTLQPSVVGAEQAAELARAKEASRLMLQGTEDINGVVKELRDELRQARAERNYATSANKQLVEQVKTLVEENRKMKAEKSRMSEYSGDQ